MADDTTPAFPMRGDEIATGLTMRDYFAAKAMQGYMASGGDIDIDGAYWFEKRAKVAYAIADAMLSAREAV